MFEQFLLPDGNTTVKTFREGSLTERRAGRCSACVLSLDICEHNVPQRSRYASQFLLEKQISHSGRVIQEGVIVQRRNMAESFELDLYSFAGFSDRVPGSPCGHHIAGLALRLGVVRTGLSEISVFPKAGLGQFSWPSNRAYSEQRRNGLIRFFPEAWSRSLFSMMVSQ